MRIIAVAGGTSPTLGRSIVTAISKTINEPVILSRKTSDRPQPLTMYGAPIRYLNYGSPQSITNALENIDTVISVIKIPGPGWAAVQIALIQGCVRAGVSRFAPAEWALGPDADGRVDVMEMKKQVWDFAKEYAGDLECSRFCPGMFMNYLACGFDFRGKEELAEELLEGLADPPLLWDIQRGRAFLPTKEDRTHPVITLTTIGDVGRFVAAACLLPDGKWQPVMGMVGETINCSEITRLIEEIIPREMTVELLHRERLQHVCDDVPGIGETREQILRKMTAQINLLSLEDDKPGKCILEPAVNELCPEVKPTTVRTYLGRLARAARHLPNPATAS